MTPKKKIILLIDNQGDFVGLFKRVMERKQLDEDFICKEIIPSGARLLDDCLEQISKLSSTEEEIAAVLIDIVLDESVRPSEKQINVIDRSGFRVAAEVRKRLPGIPILGITQWSKVQGLLTDVTLDGNFDGLLLKGILTKDGFSKAKFYEYLDKARRKHSIHALGDIDTAEESSNDVYRSFLSVVCALDSPELESIRQLSWSWTETTIPNDDTLYFKGAIEKDGEQRVVHAAATARMGLPATSILSMKMIANFRPEYLVMTGITAGVPGKVKFGDIIVADPSWNYDNGKWVIKNKKLTFLPAPHQLPLLPALRSKFRRMSADVATLSQIKHGWVADKPDHELSLLIGPLATGASVSADGTTADRVMMQHRELLGIEMETYGVFAAAVEATAPRPTVFSLKSVVDFADGNKTDKYQKYAAYTSAQALKHFVENYL